jgi:hypothetical protein
MIHICIFPTVDESAFASAVKKFKPYSIGRYKQDSGADARRIYGGGMVAIFTESLFAPLALIILLAGASRHQLDGGGNGLGFLVVFH